MVANSGIFYGIVGFSIESPTAGVSLASSQAIQSFYGPEQVFLAGPAELLSTKAVKKALLPT